MKLNGSQIQTMDEWRFCPMANFICPTARCTKNEVNTPRGLAFTAFRIHRGELLPEPSATRVFYECSTGGLCATKALDGTDVPALIRAVRANLVGSGHAPIPVEEARARILLYESLDGSHAEQDAPGSEWAEALLIGTPWLTEAHQIQYRAAVALLQQAGVAFATPSAPIGSAGLLYELGYSDDAREALLKLFEAVETTKPKRVVFPSPYDLRAIRAFASELGIDPPGGVEWWTAATWIGTLVAEGRLEIKQPLAGATGLLEPSYAVHELGETHQALFRAVVSEPIDLRWPGEATRTCGGATLSAVYPDLAASVMAKTAEEAMVHRTVDRLVSSCPFVVSELRASGLAIAATDLLTVLVEAVGG